MSRLIKSKWSSRAGSCSVKEYKKYIAELIEDETVRSMDHFKHHGRTSCLLHSLNVSFYSYLICRTLGLNYIAAARGGLLHDLFLYDWHCTKTEKGLHGFTHPHVALKNALSLFPLNELEKDIIVKHMWPLTYKMPRYRESLIVAMVDKYCACVESLGLSIPPGTYRRIIGTMDKTER